MYVPALKTPLLFVASLGRHRPSILPATLTRLFASTAPYQHDQEVVFPGWLRLKGLAPFEDRQRITSQVADSISSSGGFLSMSNMLSDMVTVMTLEDVEPDQIGAFQRRLGEIENFRLDAASLEQLRGCQTLLNENEYSNIKIPPSVFCNLQVSWIGAPGRLRQDIPADG